MSRQSSVRRYSIFSDADDEGSPRGRKSRRAFELERDEHHAKPNKFRSALRRIQKRISPHKRSRKLLQNGPERQPLAQTIRTVNSSPNHIPQDDGELTWEQHLFQDLSHRTPDHSPRKQIGTPHSTVTEIEDTPQRPSYPSTASPRQSGQRLADIVSSSEFDPFVDDQWIPRVDEREFSLHSWKSETTDENENRRITKTLSLHPLGTRLNSGLAYAGESDLMEDEGSASVGTQKRA